MDVAGSAPPEAEIHKQALAGVPDVPHRGMCARSWDTMDCINIQDTIAIVSWTPMMAGTLMT
jgi:uncharacterized protein YgiB involved in biofilm formation